MKNFYLGIFLFLISCQHEPTKIQSDPFMDASGIRGWNSQSVSLDLRSPFERDLNPVAWASSFDLSDYCPQGKLQISESDFLKMAERLALKGVALDSEIWLIVSDSVSMRENPKGKSDEKPEMKPVEKMKVWLGYLGFEKVKVISTQSFRNITRKESMAPKASVAYWRPLFIEKYKNNPELSCKVLARPESQK